MKNWIFLAFGKILVLVVVFFSIKIQIKKELENWIFFSFWQDLGFGACFFSIKILIKKLENCIFLAFGKILVLVVAFSN